MIYAMSDIHGNFEKFEKILEKINFTENDNMFLLGDVIDRGADGIQILLDMMARKNIIPLLGNHEKMMLDSLFCDDDSYKNLDLWLQNGGAPTYQAFFKLSVFEQKMLFRYLTSFSRYAECQIENKNFVLVHGGLGNYRPGKKLSEYSLDELLWTRIEMKKRYFDDNTYLVVGHTPTFMIKPGCTGILKIGNNINIDCGAGQGGRLGCIELTSMKEYYV